MHVASCTLKSTSSRMSFSEDGDGAMTLESRIEEEDDEGNFAPMVTFESVNKELDRLRKDKISSLYEIERHKKRVTYAIMFGIFGLVSAICMIIWR